MEAYAGAALVGLFAGAVIGHAAGRVVDTTLDLASAGASRAIYNLFGKDQDDPEVKYVMSVFEELDVSSKLRITNSFIDNLESQQPQLLLKQNTDDESLNPLYLALYDVKKSREIIEETMNEILKELKYHTNKYFHNWRYSSVRPLLNKLRREIAILDKRVDMLVKCKMIYADSVYTLPTVTNT